MVKTNIFALSLLLARASAFAPVTQPAFSRSIRYMSDEAAVEEVAAPEVAAPPSDPAGALVPISEETVEFTAGLVGGAVGFAVGGPVLAAVSAAAANYFAKSEGETGEIIGAVSKSAIEVYNYLRKLDTKYTLLEKAKASLEESLVKVKAQNSSSDTIEKVEEALKSVTDKITEVNDEYDLVGAGVTALGVVGDLVEKAVNRASELNEEYKLTDKATSALKDATEKAKAKM